MTTATPAASKAAKFADDAEALGWQVVREKIAEGGRRVLAERGDEGYEMVWHRNTRGSLVFAYGTYTGPSGVDTNLSGPTAVLRDMGSVRTANGSLLPFDPATADDDDVLAAVAGREVYWRSPMLESLGGVSSDHDTVPRGGLHLRIEPGNSGATRTLTFAGSMGFRSVQLCNITKVRD